MAVTPKQAPQPKEYQGQAGGKNTAFTMQRRLISQKVHEFELISNFTKEGYRNREDITILPPGVLVIGSYNVLTNVYGRIGVTKGYTLDGQANNSLEPITSSFDFTKVLTNDTHMRSYDVNLQYRYTNPVTNITTWNIVFPFLVPGNSVNYCSFWNPTSLTNQLLFVNDTPAINMWSGAVASFLSGTATTITKSGTENWHSLGFDESVNYTSGSSLTFTQLSATGGGSITDPDGGFLNPGNISVGDIITISGTTNNNNSFTVVDVSAGIIIVGANEIITNETSSATITYDPQIVINGTVYTYSGGVDTTTLTGISADASSTPIGDAIAQGVLTYQNTVTRAGEAGNESLPVTYNNTLIANLDNQIFIGSSSSGIIYTSITGTGTPISGNNNPATPFGSFLDFSFQSKSRIQYDGATTTIAGFPNAFINQEDALYISAGKDLWYETQIINTTTSVTVAGNAVSTVYQTLQLQQLKTTALQACRSQSAATKIKNDIVFCSFEPIINSLGRVTDILVTPQVTDLSYSIVNDMNRYDLTDLAMIYFRQFLYVSIPKEGIIRIYNMTQPKTQYWEAPITFPIGRFSIINDQLYGHGYTVPETYKLFDGYTFNGSPIPAAAWFSYNQYGARGYPKDFNLFYLEGYITSNCTLNYTLNYDIDGCQTSRSYTLNGSQKPQVCLPLQDDASLGKAPLGSRPLSGLTIPKMSVYSTNTGLPPKFRAIKQLSKFPFYELQIGFTSLGKDQQWELIACGPASGPATEGNVSIQY